MFSLIRFLSLPVVRFCFPLAVLSNKQMYDVFLKHTGLHKYKLLYVKEQNWKAIHKFESY